MKKLLFLLTLFLSPFLLFAQWEDKIDSMVIGKFDKYRKPIQWEKPKKGLVYEYDHLGRGSHSLGIYYHYDWKKYSSDSYWENNSYQTSCFLFFDGKSVRLRAENFPTLKEEGNMENLGKLSSMIEISYDKEHKFSLYGETPNIVGLTYLFSFRCSFGVNAIDYRINGSRVWYSSLPKNWFSLRIETPIPLRFGKVISLTRIAWVEGVVDEYVSSASWISTEVRWGRVELKGSLTRFWDNGSDYPPSNLLGNLSMRIFFL